MYTYVYNPHAHTCLHPPHSTHALNSSSYLVDSVFHESFLKLNNLSGKNKIAKIGPVKTNFMSLGFPNWHGFLSNVNRAEGLPKSSHSHWDKIRMLCTWHLLEMEDSGSSLWRKISLINKTLACFRPVISPLTLRVKTTASQARQEVRAFSYILALK